MSARNPAGSDSPGRGFRELHGRLTDGGQEAFRRPPTVDTDRGLLRYALIFERLVERPAVEVIAGHKRRLAKLDAEGFVAMAGPFEGGGGLVILDVRSADEARGIAEADPFVLHGTHGYRLVRWLQDLGPSGLRPLSAP